MPLRWTTDLFSPFSLLLCQSLVKGQLLEAGNERLRAQEGTLFISLLFISIRDCSIVVVFCCFVLFCFAQTFNFA